MSLVQINWHPGRKELRNFGLGMIIGFGLIGAMFLWKHHLTVAIACWVFGGVAGLLGLTQTKAALSVYWAWMGVALVTGNIMSRVVLTVFYYGMVTPMALIMRLIGRDKLQLRRRKKDTYWLDAENASDKRQYERQF